MLVYETDGKRRAQIEEDEAAGFYLYILDVENGACTHDYLQDTLEMALDQAEEEFALRRAGWKQAF